MEQRSKTANELCNFLDQFISDNSRSPNVDDRWLADYLKTALPMCREVRNNNLGPATRAKVNAFRALEIGEEMTRKRRELEILERDLKKLKTAGLQDGSVEVAPGIYVTAAIR